MQNISNFQRAITGGWLNMCRGEWRALYSRWDWDTPILERVRPLRSGVTRLETALLAPKLLVFCRAANKTGKVSVKSKEKPRSHSTTAEGGKQRAKGENSWKQSKSIKITFNSLIQLLVLVRSCCVQRTRIYSNTRITFDFFLTLKNKTNKQTNKKQY